MISVYTPQRQLTLAEQLNELGARSIQCPGSVAGRCSQQICRQPTPARCLRRLQGLHISCGLAGTPSIGDTHNCWVAKHHDCLAHSLTHAALQEPWLIAVLSIQTLLFFSVLVFHKNISYLTGVFVVASRCLILCSSHSTGTFTAVLRSILFAVLLVYSSERLNKILGQQWKTFAGQPYFDKNGIFISAVLSAPLVLDMLVILVSFHTLPLCSLHLNSVVWLGYALCLDDCNQLSV